MTTQTQALTAGQEGDRRAAQMAAGSATLREIAAAFDPPLSIEQAQAAVSRGRHQLNQQAPKPTPVVRAVLSPSPPAPAANSAPEPIEQLLAWAETSGPGRAVTLAARTRSQLKELADLRESQQASAKERELIATLEKQLAEAKARLRGATGGKPASSARDQQPLGVPSSVIRAWAREQGHQVAPLGRVPAELVAAYEAAHPGSGAD